jgi:DNA repair and recombination RAD54-like protein
MLSKPINSVALKPTRTSNREKTTKTVLSFHIDSSSENSDEEFQPRSKKTPSKKKRALSDSESDFSDQEHIEKKTRIVVRKRLTSNSESDVSDREQKPRAILKCLPSNQTGKFLPVSRNKGGYDARSVLSKKFKVPTMVSKPDQHGKTMPLPVEPINNNFGERKTLGIRRRAGHMMRALYDHTAEGAIVLWDPDNQPVQEEIKITTDKPKKKKTLAEILGLKKEERKLGHVVVDPALARVLRPHQIEGVKFMYQCATGKVYPDAYGCIMADEMGLGKTLQCITLVWTLLQQSEEIGKSTCQKAIITCPSSLVKNWANEFGIVSV